MDRFPSNPLARAQHALLEVREGRWSSQELSAFVEALDQQTLSWRQQLDAIPSPGSPEGDEVFLDTEESLAAMAEAVQALRGYVATGDPKLAELALELLSEASELLVQLFAVTEQALQDLEG